MNDSLSPKSLQIDSFTSHYSRTQVLNGTKYSIKICGRQALKNFTWSILEHFVSTEPPQRLLNSSSCIDITFTSQPNLVSYSSFHSSLHRNCHHQITFAKLDLRIEYPTLYERLVWYYK